MAFDRSDPADLAALKLEVETDPIGMGYDPSHHPGILRLINDPVNNIGGEATERPFNIESMLDALDVDDLDAGSTNTHAAQYIAMLANVANNHDITPYKEDFRSLFGGGNSTVPALDAQNRALSRGEVLFGEGTEIVKDDWFAARDS